MPIPEPRKNESRQEFVERCMSAQDNEDKPREQKVAICLDAFSRKNENKEKQ